MGVYNKVYDFLSGVYIKFLDLISKIKGTLKHKPREKIVIVECLKCKYNNLPYRHMVAACEPSFVHINIGDIKDRLVFLTCPHGHKFRMGMEKDLKNKYNIDLGGV